MHSGFLICHSSPPRPMWPGPGWQGPGEGIRRDQRWWHLRWFKAPLRFNKWLCPAVTMAVTSWHRWTHHGCLSPSSSSFVIPCTSSSVPSLPLFFLLCFFYLSLVFLFFFPSLFNSLSPQRSLLQLQRPFPPSLLSVSGGSRLCSRHSATCPCHS